MARTGRRSEAGTATVEFAIVLPLLMLILVGVLEWGRYFVLRESVVHAAREGARGGTLLDATQADACAAALAFLSTIGLAPSCPGDIAVDMDAKIAGGGGPLPAVAVQIDVLFESVTKLPLLIPTTIHVEAVMPAPKPPAGGT